MSLTQRLFALVVLAFLPAGLALAVFSADLEEARKEEVYQAAIRQTQRASGEIERLSEGLRTLLLAVSSAPVVKGFEEERCHAYLGVVHAALPHIERIVAVDAAGDLRCADLDARRASYARFDYFQEVKAGGDLVIGRLSEDPLDPDVRGVPFAAPIRGDDGAFRGMVVAVLSLDHLDSIVRQWSLPQGGALLIADRDGMILARNPLPERFVGTRIPEPYQSWVHAAEPGVGEIVSQDGTRRIQAYKPEAVPPVGLYISSGLSADASYAALSDARRRSFYILAAMAVLAAALAMVVAVVSIRRPVRELVALADAWRIGRPEAARPKADAAEFAAIAEALDRMGEGLRAEQAAVRESEERLRLTVRAAPVPLMLHADDGEILEISEAWFARSGFGSVGRASDWFRAALRDSGGEHDPAVTEPGEGVERVITMPSGATRVWEFATVPLGALADGRALRLTAASDVTERQLAAAREDLMVRELNHRVKNTLAVVQAIAAQTIRPTGDPAEMAERFGARIAALSRTHDLLTVRAWDVVELAELAGKEVGHLASGDRVAIEGPVVRLPSETALSIGLILHELATNAVKYGALSTPEGRIRIAWTVEEAEPGTLSIRLAWTETGGPPPDEAPDRKGFGSRLIAQVSRSLGEGSLTLTPEGARYVLAFQVPGCEKAVPAPVALRA